MPSGSDRRDRVVLQPRSAALHGTRPPAGNLHPVQPRHAAQGAPPPERAGQSAGATPHPVQPRPASQHQAGATLGPAIERMLKHYSPEQVAGQIHRWHPDWSAGQIRSQMNAAGSSGASSGTSAPPRTPRIVATATHASANLAPGHKRHGGWELELAAIGGSIAYSAYFAARGAYHAANYVPLGFAVQPGLAAVERGSLAGDIYFDRIERRHGDPRTAYDEGRQRQGTFPYTHWGPRHLNLPGLHPGGRTDYDPFVPQQLTRLARGAEHVWKRDKHIFEDVTHLW